MAPWELEAVIENIEAHEQRDELRERARERTAQRLGALKKADEAARCRQFRMNGETCGSPAMKSQDFCYFHGEAGTNNPERRNSSRSPFSKTSSACSSPSADYEPRSPADRSTTKPDACSSPRSAWRRKTEREGFFPMIETIEIPARSRPAIRIDPEEIPTLSSQSRAHSGSRRDLGS